MSDPLRTEGSPRPEAASNSERDAKVEQLLLNGLDHYFDGEYERAINVWTRVLFLHRGHRRARAYIERARSASAERVHREAETYRDGTALSGGVRSDQPGLVPSSASAARHAAEAERSVRRRLALWIALGGATVVLAGFALASGRGLTLPWRGDIVLARARALSAEGRVQDALAALDEIRPTDP